MRVSEIRVKRIRVNQGLGYMITQENGKNLVNLLQYRTQIKGIVDF